LAKEAKYAPILIISIKH